MTDYMLGLSHTELLELQERHEKGNYMQSDAYRYRKTMIVYDILNGGNSVIFKKENIHNKIVMETPNKP